MPHSERQGSGVSYVTHCKLGEYYHAEELDRAPASFISAASRTSAFLCNSMSKTAPGAAYTSRSARPDSSELGRRQPRRGREIFAGRDRRRSDDDRAVTAWPRAYDNAVENLHDGLSGRNSRPHEPGALNDPTGFDRLIYSAAVRAPNL